MPSSGRPNGSNDDDDLLALMQRVVVDLAVLAPIGLVKRARTLIPELIEEGRTTVASAQTIGRFVTPILRKQGKKLVTENVATVRPRRTPTASTPKISAPQSPQAPDSDTGSDTGTGSEPFAGYDHLGSAAVVARLGEFSAAQRRAIRSYEASHRNRRTVLGRLDQLDSH